MKKRAASFLLALLMTLTLLGDGIPVYAESKDAMTVSTEETINKTADNDASLSALSEAELSGMPEEPQESLSGNGIPVYAESKDDPTASTEETINKTADDDTSLSAPSEVESSGMSEEPQESLNGNGIPVHAESKDDPTASTEETINKTADDDTSLSAPSEVESSGMSEEPQESLSGNGIPVHAESKDNPTASIEETINKTADDDISLATPSEAELNAVSEEPPEATALDAGIPIDTDHFPDDTFRKCVKDKADTNGDGILSETERAAVNVWRLSNTGISDLEGIEHFTELTFLLCDRNNLTSLDLTSNTKLETLDVSYNQLTDIDVSSNSELEQLQCGANALTSLDVSGCPKLKRLYCTENQLTAIDVSANTKLEDLTLSYNQLTEIDVSHNLLLHQLACDENPLTELDVSTNKELERLICGETMLTSLDVSNNPKLEWLYCQNNVYTIEVLDGQAFNMTSLPGTFDKTKAGEFSAGSYNLATGELTIPNGITSLTYNYDMGWNGNEGLVGPFKLNIVRKPALPEIIEVTPKDPNQPFNPENQDDGNNSQKTPQGFVRVIFASGEHGTFGTYAGGRNKVKVAYDVKADQTWTKVVVPAVTAKPGYTAKSGVALWNPQLPGETEIVTGGTYTAQYQKNSGDQVVWYQEIYLQNPDGTFSRWSYGQGGFAKADTTVRMNLTAIDGQQTAWGYTLGIEYVFDADNAQNRLSDIAGNAGRKTPLRAYYKRAPHKVTYQYEGAVPDGAPAVPAKVESWYGANVPIAEAPTLAGYVFSGWTTDTAGAVIDKGILTMPNTDVILKGAWAKVAATTAIVTFRVVNGAWADGTTADKLVTVPLISGKGTLDTANIPTGMKANSGYTNGMWDIQPNTVPNAVTGDVVYTYSFKPNKPDMIYQVTFKFISLTKDENGQPKDLPQSVQNLLPAPLTGLKQGDTVTYPLLDKTSISLADGTWVFTGWPGGTGATINGNVLEVGGWRFDKTPIPPEHEKLYYPTMGIYIDGKRIDVPQDGPAGSNANLPEAFKSVEVTFGGVTRTFSSGTVGKPGFPLMIKFTDYPNSTFTEGVYPYEVKNVPEGYTYEMIAKEHIVDSGIRVDGTLGNIFVSFTKTSTPPAVAKQVNFNVHTLVNGTNGFANKEMLEQMNPVLRAEDGQEVKPVRIADNGFTFDFENVPAGEYTLIFTYPAGYRFAPGKVGSDMFGDYSDTGTKVTVTAGNVVNNFYTRLEKVPDGPNPPVAPPVENTGNLTVTKTVSGSRGDQNKEFTFTVTLDKKDFSGQYGDMTFANGVATFTLKHGQSKAATGLPAGMSYTVDESDNSGYTVTKTNATGKIQDSITAIAAFENYRGSSGGNSGGNGGSSSHTPQAARVTLTATKTLDSLIPTGSGFTFFLDDANGQRLQMKNNQNGNIAFDTLTFKQTGTYVYYLAEQAGVDSNINYDTSTYKVTVTVTCPYDYAASVSYEKNGQTYNGIPAFTNTTKSAPQTAPPANSHHLLDRVPKTEDTTNLGLWGMLTLLSALSLTALALCENQRKMRYRNRHQKR